MAQLNGENLIVVKSTADAFRAAVSALRSLDGKDGASFHTFMLAEDRCVRLLVEKLGRGVPESVAREELESLNIRVQESHADAIRPSRSGLRQGPTSHPQFIVSVARGPEVSKVRWLTELCGLRVSAE